MREIKVGDLSPTRDFNFVHDTCRGFLALARAENVDGREINIATGTEVSTVHISRRFDLGRKHFHNRQGMPAAAYDNDFRRWIHWL